MQFINRKHYVCTDNKLFTLYMDNKPNNLVSLRTEDDYIET